MEPLGNSRSNTTSQESQYDLPLHPLPEVGHVVHGVEVLGPINKQILGF